MSRPAKRTLNFGAAVVMITACVIAITWLASPVGSTPAQAESDAVESTLAMNPAVRLIQLGFDAPMLAAGGANTAVVEAMYSRLSSMPEKLEHLSELEAAQTAAMRVVQEIRSEVRASGATASRLASLHEATTILTTRRAARKAASEALHDTILELLANHLGEDGVVICERFHSNRHRMTPNRFKALDLSEAKWRTLESASLKQLADQDLNAQEISLMNQCELYPITAIVASRLMVNEPAIAAVVDGMAIADN